MSSRQIYTTALSIVLLLITSPALSDPRDPVSADDEPRNGDIVIGTSAEGPDLDNSVVPDRPLLVVIDTPYEIFDDSGTLVHVAAWRLDGRPARGARVYLADHLIGRMSAQGTLVFRWGVRGAEVEDYWSNRSEITVRWERRDHTCEGSVWFSALARTGSFASDHLFVYADRGVYNPGETVHIRSIAWHLAADWTPLEGADVELMLLDPSRRAIAGRSVESDEFGVTATDFTLPEHAQEGTYRLTASYEGAEAEAQLRVERFVAPVIQIEHDIGRFLTRDQDELNFEVHLDTFTGAAFTAGTVSIDLLRYDTSHFHTQRDVDGSGPHAFTIGPDALGELRELLSDGEQLQVEIAVEDDTGRHDRVRRDLTYRVNPYVAVIELDRFYYSTGDSVEIIVRLTDIERVPVRDRSIFLYSSNGERLEGLTDNGGIAQFTLTMPDDGFEVSARLPDVEHTLASAWVQWQQAQPMRSHIADAIVAEGEWTHVNVTFPSHFAPAESVVHLDVVDSSGSLVNSALIPIRQEGDAYIAEGDFIAPSWGSMLLTLFCLGRDEGDESVPGRRETALGVLTEGQNLAVHPNRELTIHLDGISDDVEPGSQLSGMIRVTDTNGDEIDAAIGLSLVDLAAISLKDPLEITPMDHFYNPELRVISTTGSAILTWPVVSRNWGSQTHDIALPPFNYQGGGQVNFTPRTVAAGAAGSVFGSLSVSGSGQGGGGVGYGYGSGSGSIVTGAAGEIGLAGAAASDSGGDGRSSRGGTGIVASPEPVITIRTEFPHTSIWEPDLRTENGRVAVTGRVPDAITVQELAIVASDRRGSVGVLRHPVNVRQPLFVSVDAPDTLTVGERVQAHVSAQNLTDAPQNVRLSMWSDDLRIVGMSPTVEVPPNGTTGTTFEVEAVRPGLHPFSISAETIGQVDREDREIWVRPSGVAEMSVVSGSPSVDEPWVASIEVPEGGQMTTVTLSLAFPAVSAGFAGLAAIRDDLASDDTMSVGGELIASALLYRYRLSRGGAIEELQPQYNDLQAMLSMLLAAQRSDGGWGFRWDDASNPYVTAYCLEALIELAELNLSIPSSVPHRAITFLSNDLRESTYDMSDIAFWEGDTDLVREGMSSEIFSVLTSTPKEFQGESWVALTTRLADRYVEYLDEEEPEFRTLAHAVLGLHHLSEATTSIEIAPDRLAEAAERLVQRRREAHWEPSWFNAYGGTIEATVTALQVLAALDRELPETDAREMIRYLLSTRDEWGGWHNPRGTASAIRGLMALAPPEEADGATVVVLVNGREIRSVSIDPADPFLSALTLRELDLSEDVGPGGNGLEVRYDGRLQPEGRIIIRHWGPFDSVATTDGEHASVGPVAE